MKLYLLTQTANTDYYNAYNSCVVCAESQDDAKKIHPSSDFFWNNEKWVCKSTPNYNDKSWTKPSNVKVKIIGEASNSMRKGVICASYFGRI
jgi:hypothetical protein